MSEQGWRALYPFTSHWRTLDAGRYHFVDEGEGPPLLFVHGNPTWSFYWRNLICAFRDQHRVVAPDHLGCGLSDKPQDYPYRLQVHIDNLVELIDALDLQNITLCGHDWGGAIAVGAALARPARVARLVLLNTAAFPPPYIPWRIRVCRTPLFGKLALQGLNLFSLAALRMAVQDPRALSPDVRAGLIAPYDCWQHRIGVYSFVQDIPATDRHPTWATLERIEQGLGTLADRPIQLIWGMRDWCFRPTCLQRFQQHWPAARTVEIPTAGHWVVEEAPEQVERALREFLRSDANHATGIHDAPVDR
jgi:haloalkane dehalogenase